MKFAIFFAFTSIVLSSSAKAEGSGYHGCNLCQWWSNSDKKCMPITPVPKGCEVTGTAKKPVKR